MADKKISQLTAATTPLAGTEVLPIVQNGTTVKASVENVLTSAQPSGTANGVSYLNASKALTTSSGILFDGSNLLVGPSTAGNGSPVNSIVSSTWIKAPRLATHSTYNDVFSYTWSSTATDVGQYGLSTFTVQTSPLKTGVMLSGYDGIAFATGGLEVGRFAVDKNFTVKSGNVVIGTSGKGIDFSATANGSGTMTSELLADYEEGTWTPVLQTDGTNFSAVTYNVVRGARYVKCGSLVHVQGWFYTDSITVGSASGNLQIGGLPYTSAANSGSSQLGRSAINVSYCVAWGATFPDAGMIEANSTVINLYYRSAADGATANVPYTSAGTGAAQNRIGFSATYVAA